MRPLVHSSTVHDDLFAKDVAEQRASGPYSNTLGVGAQRSGVMRLERHRQQLRGRGQQPRGALDTTQACGSKRTRRISLRTRVHQRDGTYGEKVVRRIRRGMGEWLYLCDSKALATLTLSRSLDEARRAIEKEARTRPAIELYQRGCLLPSAGHWESTMTVAYPAHETTH